VFAPVLAKKYKIPLIYFLGASAILQVVGFALLSLLDYETKVSGKQYGYQILAGW
jgi:hypothetical protein